MMSIVHSRAVFLLLMACCLGACTSIEEESADEPEREAEKNPATDELSDALENAAEAVKEALGGADLTDFRDLRDLLPDEVSHLDRTDWGGEQLNVLGLSLSHASATYEDDGQSLEISISDLGTLSAVVAVGMASWLDVEIDRESNRGYERTRKYRSRGKTYQTYERYEGADGTGSCEIQIWVADRFIVGIEGEDVEMGRCDEARDEIPFPKLERLSEEAEQHDAK